MQKNIITKSFRSKLFGTDGIRAQVGQEPLTPEAIAKLAKAIGIWAQKKYTKHMKILIGHDTRKSCDMIKTYLISNLLLILSPETRIYDAHILPTPAIIKLVMNEPFDLGIIITASHNPYQDNGIKIIDKQGKLTKVDEEVITELFFSQTHTQKHTQTHTHRHTNTHAHNTHPDNKFFTPFTLHTTHRYVDFFHKAQEKYKTIVLQNFKKNSLKNLKIVLDCAHGATYKVAPEIFKKLGAHVIAITNTPNGENINNNCGSLHPQKLQETVHKQNAHIGFAFDGDGDRITVVTQKGEIKDGDDILCLLSHNPEYKASPTYYPIGTHVTMLKKSQNSIIIGTIMTNYGLEVYLKQKGISLIRTKVGDKCVSKEMKAKKVLLGGEPSGHILLHNYLCCSDGIFTALKIIETIKLTNNWELNTFEKIPQKIINIPVKEKRSLEEPKIAKIITKHKNNIKNGRIIVRYSGTENLLRVMVEEQDTNLAKNICKNLSKELKEICNN